jgi:hypothetical protein
MSVVCEIDSTFLILRLEERHAHSDERDALSRALVDPRLSLPVRLLVDARASQTNPDGESIADRARCLGRLGRGALTRCAVVVSTPLQYGLARMFAAYAIHGGINVAIFHDEPTARGWLGRDESASDVVADQVEGFTIDAPLDGGVATVDRPAALSDGQELAARRNRPDAKLPGAPAADKPSIG